MLKIKNTKEWLLAINELQEYYKKFDPNKNPSCINICPLCRIVGTKCTKCLWMLLSKEIYLLYSSLNIITNKYHCIYIVKDHTSIWNIERLEKWKKILLEKEKK